MKSINFLYAGIPLDYRAAQTRRSLSKLRANYHLFLRNQPKQPENMTRSLVIRRPRMWKAPLVRF